MSENGKRVRVGIVGCGRMGGERAARAAGLGAEIQGCADSDVERARALASKAGAKIAVADPAMLPWDQLDAVFVCTPPSVRRDVVQLALQARVATMVEKPIGLRAEDGEELAEAVARAGIINAVGYMNRYRESVRLAKSLAERHEVVAVMCHWACKPYSVPWWGLADQSGGAINEQATHVVDLCRFVAGEVTEVKALSSGARDATDGATTRIAAALLFKSGAVGTLAYTCDAPDKFIAFEIVTRAGALRLEGWDFALAWNTIEGASLPGLGDAFEAETRAFLTAAATKEQSLIACSFEEAVRTQAVVDSLRATAAAMA